MFRMPKAIPTASENPVGERGESGRRPGGGDPALQAAFADFPAHGEHLWGEVDSRHLMQVLAAAMARSAVPVATSRKRKVWKKPIRRTSVAAARPRPAEAEKVIEKIVPLP